MRALLFSMLFFASAFSVAFAAGGGQIPQRQEVSVDEAEQAFQDFVARQLSIRSAAENSTPNHCVAALQHCGAASGHCSVRFRTRSFRRDFDFGNHADLPQSKQKNVSYYSAENFAATVQPPSNFHLQRLSFMFVEDDKLDKGCDLVQPAKGRNAKGMSATIRLPLSDLERFEHLLSDSDNPGEYWLLYIPGTSSSIAFTHYSVRTW